MRCFGDSDLVAQQVSGTWDSKDPLMAAYHREVDAIAGHFKGYQVEHVDRGKNEAADALSRLGSQCKPVLLGNVAEIQNFPTCHQDLSMERPATRGRRVHLHTLVDR